MHTHTERLRGLIAEGENVHFAGKQHGKEQTKQDGNPRRGEIFVRDAGKSADEKGAGIIDGIREKVFMTLLPAVKTLLKATPARVIVVREAPLFAATA